MPVATTDDMSTILDAARRRKLAGEATPFTHRHQLNQLHGFLTKFTSEETIGQKSRLQW